ncbi:hypothetical protein ACFOYW_00525 [Gryllotalpicola reticulitermitis]|uniref:Uncharacterized protein n=1 Tax=Gryllotalpicola reticulitermitis TaxID=1184153 RepID=A0ABV8Q0D3_9MICO
MNVSPSDVHLPPTQPLDLTELNDRLIRDSTAPQPPTAPPRDRIHSTEDGGEGPGPA